MLRARSEIFFRTSNRDFWRSGGIYAGSNGGFEEEEGIVMAEEEVTRTTILVEVVVPEVPVLEEVVEGQEEGRGLGMEVPCTLIVICSL
jgi:hypothetical protein